MGKLDYQTFYTRREAKREAAKMQGWVTKVVGMFLPEDANADSEGYVWVIQCWENPRADALYLRTDGYVR